MKSDIFFMQQAVAQAKKAEKIDEVPIGAVLVDQDGQIIAKGYSQVEKHQNQQAHAEMLVLKKACKKKGSWRLLQTTLYVTLQPCMMCLGALYLSRVSRIVYGVRSLKFGISVDEVAESSIYKNLAVTVDYIEDEESKLLLKQFFKKKRREADVKKG